jgi:hypothetical protein
VNTSKLGHKMLGKNKRSGEWANVVLTRAQQNDGPSRRGLADQSNRPKSADLMQDAESPPVDDGQPVITVRCDVLGTDGQVLRVRSHCRFRNRGAESLRESGMERTAGGAKRQRRRTRQVLRRDQTYDIRDLRGHMVRTRPGALKRP